MADPAPEQQIITLLEIEKLQEFAPVCAVIILGLALLLVILLVMILLLILCSC